MHARSLALLAFAAAVVAADPSPAAEPGRPNIVFAFADDWGKHAGAYGTPVVKTPTFDRIAAEGVIFENAFAAAPSCTPSRNAILTGQWPWRLHQGVNLWSGFPDVPVFTDLLAGAGYHVGHYRKAWGPGKLEFGERKTNPAGPRFNNPKAFFAARDEGQPFFFWFGASDPHRPFEEGSGEASGMDLDAIEVPGYLPDARAIRSDMADYFFEVERFDREVGELLATIEAMGELDNTLVVMSGDHGMPFPRAKSNLYDSGSAVGLAVQWPGRVPAGRVPAGRRLTDFVSLADLAPTFLEAAGVEAPAVMTARGLMAVLESEGAGQVDPERNHVIAAKERHVPSQPAPSAGGYPSRMIRTADHLYIRNLDPDRWPNGVLDPAETFLGRALADTDDGPSKKFVVDNRDDPDGARFFAYSFARRPLEELYVLADDPDQLRNVADDPEMANTKAKLWERLESELRATGDPRILGTEEAALFDRYPYVNAPEGNPIWDEFVMPPR
ncbi:sulfatase [soil metagenome]